MGKRRWNPTLHPRDDRGRFIDSSLPGREWVGALSDRIATERGDILGPQGPYTSPAVWRSFPAGVVQIGDQWLGDPMDPKQQIDGSVEDFGGLGQWYGPEDMAQFYANNDGSVVVAVRFRPEDLKKAVDPTDASGIVAPRGTEVAVVAMRVSIDGKWHILQVPPGLTAPTLVDD